MRDCLHQLAIVAVVSAIVPPAGRAQPAGAPAREPTATARAYVNAGLAAQADGDYEAAISLYERAFGLVPHPALLFNLGQAHRLAGNRAEALRAYRAYVAEVDGGALRAQALRWIEVFEHDIAVEQAAAEAERRAALQAAAQAAKARRAAKAAEDRRRAQDHSSTRGPHSGSRTSIARGKTRSETVKPMECRLVKDGFRDVACGELRPYLCECDGDSPVPGAY